MRVKKSILERIVREELTKYFLELREDFSLQAEKEKKKGPGVIDADDEKGAKEKAKGDDEKAPKGPGKPPSGSEKGAKGKLPSTPRSDDPAKDEPPELPVGDEPSGADSELETGPEDGEEDGEEDAADVTGGKISDEVVGKRIQSLTMEPDSKTLPGAQEINVTFDESPEPLKILITKTGQVKFFHRGGLHNKI